MRLSIVAAAMAMLIAGCAEPPSSEEPPSPAGQDWSRTQSAPAAGVEWTNYTGTIAPAACERASMPVDGRATVAWWIKASPVATLFVDRIGLEERDACQTRSGIPLYHAANQSQATGSEHIVPEGRGMTFGVACEGSAPCEVRLWIQRVASEITTPTVRDERVAAAPLTCWVHNATVPEDDIGLALTVTLTSGRGDLGILGADDAEDPCGRSRRWTPVGQVETGRPFSLSDAYAPSALVIVLACGPEASCEGSVHLELGGQSERWAAPIGPPGPEYFG